MFDKDQDKKINSIQALKILDIYEGNSGGASQVKLLRMFQSIKNRQVT